MLMFKKEKKKELLNGRTIRYLTKNNKVACSEVHLSNVLNGKTKCSLVLAKDIVSCVNGKVEDYFTELES